MLLNIQSIFNAKNTFVFANLFLKALLKFVYGPQSIFVFVHIYPPFTRKRIVSLYFGRDVRTRLGVAIFEVSGPPVFHIKAEATR